MVGTGMQDVDAERAAEGFFTYLFKLVVLGNAETGKSSALQKFTDGTYRPNYIATIGVDFRTKTVQMCGEIAKLQIWDTSGQEKFRTITNSYYRGAQGIFLFFDLTNKESFDAISGWKADVEKNGASDVAVILVGSKCDLKAERQVGDNEIQTLANQLNLEYFEISSETGQGVNRIFERMLDQILQTKKQQDNDQKPVASTMASEIMLKKRNENKGNAKKSKTCTIL